MSGASFEASFPFLRKRKNIKNYILDFFFFSAKYDANTCWGKQKKILAEVAEEDSHKFIYVSFGPPNFIKINGQFSHNVFM